jgi:hypothetical protein
MEQNQTNLSPSAVTPKVVATIGLRIAGVWMILESFCVTVAMPFASGYLPYMALGMHRRWYDGGNATAATSDFYFHDVYYMFAHSVPGLPAVAIRFVVGLVLIFASKPLARLVARNLDPR